MSYYDIFIDYSTGNSFGSERIPEESVGVITSDIKKAKENLRRIKDHYLKYSDSANFDARYELTLLTDDGERTILPFWIGYFERLHGAKIVVADDPDMEFTL